MKMKIPTCCLAIGAALFVTGFDATAQVPTAPGRENPPPRRRLQQPDATARPPAMDPMLNVLNGEQRVSFRQAMQAQREEIRAINTELGAARQRLLDASLAAKFDEGKVRRLALGVARLQADVSVLRMKALSQVRPPLSPDQIRRIKNAPPQGPARAGVRDGQRPPRGGQPRPLVSPDRDPNGLPPKP